MQSLLKTSRLGLVTSIALLVLWAGAPFVLGRGSLDLLVFAAIYSIGAIGLGVALGYGGIINLAQAVFYALGAFSVAITTTRWGIPSLAAFPIAFAVAGLTGVILGWPILRLQGFFLALATLALTIMAGALFLEWDGITGGTLGLGGIPPLMAFGFNLSQPVPFYYLVWIIVLGCVVLVRNIVGARPGLGLRAMRSSPDAARALGITIHGLRVRVFVLSALLGSLAGALFASYVGFVSVQSFTVERSVAFLLAAVVGGTRNPAGPIVGALFVVFAPEAMHGLGDLHQVLFGLLLVFVVIAMPDGITGLLTRLGKKLQATQEPAASSATVVVKGEA
jgi:branched-chain amino acid transport system permease protein